MSPMMLQKRNSDLMWRPGCSAFEVLAKVVIERPGVMRRAKAKSAILHSCIMAQESREYCHNAHLCKHSFGKRLLPRSRLVTLFLQQSINDQKGLKACAWVWEQHQYRDFLTGNNLDWQGEEIIGKGSDRACHTFIQTGILY